VKVLAISSYGGTGGSELSFAAFIEWRPADVEAIPLVLETGPLATRLAESGLPCRVATGLHGRPSPASFVSFAPKLWALLRRERPEVIWAMGQKAALLAAPAARAHGTPLVWHKVDFSWDRSLALPTAVAVDGVIAVSHAVTEALGPLRHRKLLGVVWPQVQLPPDLEASPDPAAPTIGTVGRLVPYKGHHLIIEAAALLRREFPSLRVILAGAAADPYPTYPRELTELATRLGVAEGVVMPGFVEPTSVLTQLNVFVNATHRDAQGFGLEGLSGAMLEASWVGLPVVATRGGGTAEGLIQNETGTLVDEPTPQALAAAIAPYLRDPALAARTGAAGRRLAVERCDPTAASRSLFSLLARAQAR
jgi:hypothetical protein